ncbi:MAG: hypothetical protein ACK5HT_14710 [Draconibacterium sp.]
MKRLYLVLVLAALFFSGYSQDLIITTKGDSINCKITKVKKDHVYFTFKHNTEVRSTLLAVSDVKYHQKNFYEIAAVPKNKVIGFGNYLRFRVAINGGFSYETAKVGDNVPADFKDYVKDLKSGYHYGGDITYYFSEPLGVGLKFNQFNSSNDIDIYLDDEYGNRTYGKMSDDLSISFIGPMFSTRLLSNSKKNAFLLNLAMGYMGYSNDKVIGGYKYDMTGSSFGMALDLGYDIGISEKLSLGFQLSLFAGSLTKYKQDDGISVETVKLEKGSYESLNRIDLSVGLRFNK